MACASCGMTAQDISPAKAKQVVEDIDTTVKLARWACSLALHINEEMVRESVWHLQLLN
jgi:hypothetical protein